MKLEKLEPGMVVYDVGRVKAGNTTMSTVSVWPVHIVSVDLERRSVLAKWNHNPAKTFYERAVSKWRLKAPVLVGRGVVRRLATRAEIAAMKAEGKA